MHPGHGQSAVLMVASLWACSGFAQITAHEAADYLQAGINEIKRGDFRSAEDQLRKAAQMDPRNPQAYNLLGFVADQTGQPQQAIRYFEEALDLAPNFTAARNNLGSAYLRLGKVTLAVEQFEKTLRSHPDDVTAHYNLGLIFLQTGAPVKAVTHLEKALSVSPQDPAVFFLLARSYFAVGRKEDGLKTALEAERSSGQEASAFFMFGALLLANQQYEHAAESLSQANMLAPHTPEILLSLARAEFHLGREGPTLETIEEYLGTLKATPEEGAGAASYLRTAEEILDGLNKHTPGSIQTGYLLAEVLFLEKDYANAIQLLKDIGHEGESKPEYWNLLGMSFAGMNQFPEASQAVIKAIDLAPQRTDLYFNLASIYQKGGDSKSALKVLDRVITEKDPPPDVSFALGLSYFNLGNYSTAQASFEKALKARPDFAEAEYFIGRCNGKLQKPLQAAQAYQRAMALKPSFYPAPYQLALLDLQTDRSQDAVPLLQQVVHLNPGFPDAHFELGKIYSNQGSLSQAITELERTITLNSDYDPAYYQLGRLYEKVGNTEKAKAMFQIVNANKERRSRTYQEKVSGPG